MKKSDSVGGSNHLRIQLIRPKSTSRPLKSNDFNFETGGSPFPKRDFNSLIRNDENKEEKQMEFRLINIDENRKNSEKDEKKLDFGDLKSYVKSFSFQNFKTSIKTQNIQELFINNRKIIERNGTQILKKKEINPNSYNKQRKNKLLNAFLTKKSENGNFDDEMARKFIENSELKKHEEFLTILKKQPKNINFDNFKVSKKYSHVKGNMAKTPKIQNLFNISQTQLMILNRRPKKKKLVSPCEALQAFYRSMLLGKNTKRQFNSFFEIENNELIIKN